MEIEVRKYENRDVSLVKTVANTYQLEVFLSPSFDENGNLNPGPYTPQDMVLTVYNLPGIREYK